MSGSDFYFFQYWGLNSGPQHLLGKLSTTWAILPALFAFIIFQIGSHFLCHPLAGMTDMYHHSQFFVV
jgi:hypothetical protein